MAEKLTPQQLEAVMNRGGNLLVSAAAGSGKTKVLVDRLMGYLKDPENPADLDEFLIITYTKAAAAELRGKIAAKLTDAVASDPDNRHLQRQLQRLYLTKISTVHAFCGDLLREYAYRLDISGDFRVADELECQDLQMRLLQELLEKAYSGIQEDPYFRMFTDTQGLGRDDRQIPELILKVYNSARCHLHPEQWLDWCLSSGNINEVTDAADTIWGKYLIDELHDYVQLQINAFRSCIDKMSNIDGMEKPLHLIQDTCYQLEVLLEASGWDAVREKLKINYGTLTFSRKCADPILAEQIKGVRNACKKGLEKRSRRFFDSSQQILSDLSSVTNAARGLINLVRQFSQAYDKLKRSHRIMDFGDLEHKTLDLLLGKSRSGPTVIATEIGSRFREVMVDEYQDSNAVQDSIFMALTSRRSNCFMVGDVKQSIYQFRLADPDIFLRKYESYSAASNAEIGKGRKVLLSSNFRSSGSVISAVNDVFTACMSKDVGGLNYGADEALYEGIPHEPVDEPEIELYGIPVQEDTYAEEAHFVAERISQLLDGTHMIRGACGLRPIGPEDIVILLRSPGSVGVHYKNALEQIGVRCTMGANTDLLKMEEVSVLYALLQIINNPLQDIPLIAVLSSKLFCFTADELASFRKENKHTDIYSALKASDSQKSQEFVSFLSDLRKTARMLKLTEIITEAINRTRIDSIFSSLPDGSARQDNLNEFCQIAASAEANGICDLPGFLDKLETVSERGLLSQSEEKTDAAVTIMSIHKSKGLEFPVVFLCAMSREFNRDSARAAVLCDKELGIGLSCVDHEKRVRYPSVIKTAISAKMMRQSISEEMRVLYVAMTRAKDRLIMTYSCKNLKKDLTEICTRMDLCDRRLLTAEVDCPGQWILLAALQRTEAGAFFALSGPAESATVRDITWLIRIADRQNPSNAADISEEPNEENATDLSVLEKGLNFRYPFAAATRTPSKQTATQQKGREKDIEAAEHTIAWHSGRSFRKPSFIEKHQDGKAYGSALHGVMEKLSYEACSSAEEIKTQIDEMISCGRIPEEWGSRVDTEKIAAFFNSELGIRLRSSQNVLREFKFSILDDGCKYTDDLDGESVLLQGVVDCAILDEDGIIIIDYKTDSLFEMEPDTAANKYRGQINAYAEALSRIFELPVKAKFLYFFARNKFVEIE